MPAEGKVVQIMGPVLDVQFPADQLPDIYNAIHIPLTEAGVEVNNKDERITGGAPGPTRLVAEV